MSKPTVSTNIDGNIFAILGATATALRRAGQREKLDEFQMRLNAEQKNPDATYSSMISLCMQYVEFEDTSDEEEEEADWDCEEEDEEDCE